jgi:O-antigen/teichoic acid export membrane protein
VIEMMRSLRQLIETASAVVGTSRSARNVVWNVFGGAWAGALIVLATPFYVSRLGLEGYGIVGLWLVMQVMMGLLDVGMGATVVKAFAGSPADHAGHAFKRDLLKTLELLYWSVALALSVVLVLASDWIGAHWLQSHALSTATVSHALQLIAIALGFQFPGGLYANGLAGLQEQGRMNVLQILGNTLRYGGGVVVLLWRPDIVWFFAMQVAVAAIQTLVTRQVLWRMIFAIAPTTPLFRIELVGQMWPFAAGMGLTALVAVLMANADRIALSRLLPTAELGKYSIAFAATGLLQLGIQPFYRAFFPRYAQLVSAGNPGLLRTVYFRSCRLMAFAIIPLGIIGWTFAPQLLTSWLGRHEETVTVVFRWLLLGITCSGLMWLPAAFQQAHGWTRLHASMIAGALLLGAPLMIWAIRTLGTVGATTVWVLHGISGITLGLWLMHRRLLVGELPEWYRVVLLPPLLLTLPLAGLSRWTMPPDLGRWASLGWVGATGLVIMACALAFGLLDARAFAPDLSLNGRD